MTHNTKNHKTKHTQYKHYNSNKKHNTHITAQTILQQHNIKRNKNNTTKT